MNTSLLQGLGAGILLGLSIAAPPGPISAAIAQRVAIKRSWVPGLVIGLGAMTADGVYLLKTYLGWTGKVSQNKGITGWVYLLGGLVLLLYASFMILKKVRTKNVDTKTNIANKKESSFSYMIG